MWNVRDLLVLIRTTIINAIKLADYKKLENTIETSDIYTSSSSLVFSPKAGFGRNQSPVRRPVWLWHTAF